MTDPTKYVSSSNKTVHRPARHHGPLPTRSSPRPNRRSWATYHQPAYPAPAWPTYHQSYPQPHHFPTQPAYPQPLYSPAHPSASWSRPPSPYPTVSQPCYPPAPQSRSARPSLLGPRPSSSTGHPSSHHEAYSATDIEQAMHTLGLNPPDSDWYMDTGATSHMTSDRGTLPSYFNSSTHIIVGDGKLIPVVGYGHTSLPPPHPPLRLNNVQHVPKIIKNLISVRKFTRDNSVSVEFDPFGFSVKDLKTGTRLLRCDST